MIDDPNYYPVRAEYRPWATCPFVIHMSDDSMFHYSTIHDVPDAAQTMALSEVYRHGEDARMRATATETS